MLQCVCPEKGTLKSNVLKPHVSHLSGHVGVYPVSGETSCSHGPCFPYVPIFATYLVSVALKLGNLGAFESLIQ